MAQSGTDSYGPWVDTGTSTPVTPRANTEIETHLVSEVDSGSKILPVNIATSHQPHRGPNSPR